jgi:hypothetical protein
VEKRVDGTCWIKKGEGENCLDRKETGKIDMYICKDYECQDTTQPYVFGPLRRNIESIENFKPIAYSNFKT